MFSRRPHRLEAQDGALSRLKREFESRWGHLKKLKGQPGHTGWLFCFGTLRVSHHREERSADAIRQLGAKKTSGSDADDDVAGQRPGEPFVAMKA